MVLLGICKKNTGWRLHSVTCAVEMINNIREKENVSKMGGAGKFLNC
jgi:hypothetical protein